LRYKDYNLAIKPATLTREFVVNDDAAMPKTGLYEFDSVKTFAEAMRQRGVLHWWRKGMGFGNE